jgi:hypothetical protein
MHDDRGFRTSCLAGRVRQFRDHAFIVNHRGKVYQKDLGPETAEIVAAMEAYDPASTWSMVTN